MAVVHDTFTGRAGPSSWTHNPSSEATRSGIYVQLANMGGHGVSAVSFGGKALTHLGSASSGNPHVCHWWLDDISGRSGNTVSVTGAGAYRAGWAVTMRCSASGLILSKVDDDEGGGQGGNPTAFSLTLQPGGAALGYIGGINDWNVNGGSDLDGQSAMINYTGSDGGWHAEHFSREALSGDHALGYSHFGSLTNVALAGIAIAEVAAPVLGIAQGFIII